MKNEAKVYLSIILLILLSDVISGKSINFELIGAICYLFIFSYLFKLIKSKFAFFILNFFLIGAFFLWQDPSLENILSDLLFTCIFSLITFCIFCIFHNKSSEDIKNGGL